jgi:hypothetical protein
MSNPTIDQFHRSTALTPVRLRFLLRKLLRGRFSVHWALATGWWLAATFLPTPQTPRTLRGVHATTNADSQYTVPSSASELSNAVNAVDMYTLPS